RCRLGGGRRAGCGAPRPRRPEPRLRSPDSGSGGGRVPGRAAALASTTDSAKVPPRHWEEHMATSKTAKTKKATFSAEEIEAMQEAKRERKKGGKADGEADLLAKIAEMDGSDKAMAERIHAIVKQVAP